MRVMNTVDVHALLVGKVVTQVVDDTLHMSDGLVIELELTADCCSSSEFTDIAQFKELEGATILNVEDRDGKSDNNPPDPTDADVLSWHFLVFTTSKGHVTIDWRNDSNGYYDGSVAWKVR